MVEGKQLLYAKIFTQDLVQCGVVFWYNVVYVVFCDSYSSAPSHGGVMDQGTALR